MSQRSGWRRSFPYVASALSALLAITAVVWALFLNREVYVLRWKFRPGEVLRYRTVSRMGSKDKTKFHLVEQSYAVESVSPDGAAELIAVVERTTIREGGPEGAVVWDSSSGAPIPKDFGIATAAAMNGVPIRYRVDARGLILSMEGMDVVKKRIRDALGGDFLGVTDVAFSSTGGAFLGVPLPESPVKKGARWRLEVGSGTQAWGKNKHSSEYSLKSVWNGVANILLVESKMEETAEGDIPKAMNIKTPPDPNAAHDSHDRSEFSISEGILRLQVSESWTQGTVSSGKVFRFEASSTTTLVERRAGK